MSVESGYLFIIITCDKLDYINKEGKYAKSGI